MGFQMAEISFRYGLETLGSLLTSGLAGTLPPGMPSRRFRFAWLALEFGGIFAFSLAVEKRMERAGGRSVSLSLAYCFHN